MTSSGQWAKLKTIDNPQSAAVLSINLQQTDWQTDKLVILDNDGKKVFHHFKIGVESASGLLNLYDKMLTIGEQ